MSIISTILAEFLDNQRNATYKLAITFVGPWATNRQDQLNRRGVIEEARLCPDLSSSPLDDALNRSHSQVCLMELTVPTADAAPNNVLPATLQEILGTRRTRCSGTVVGMYVFDAENPCVLQYICIARGFQDLDSMLLLHWERAVRTTYPGQCKNLYLAAAKVLDKETRVNKSVLFYQRNGYDVITVPDQDDARKRPTEIILNDTKPIRILLYADTVLMSKDVSAGQFGLNQTPLPTIGTRLGDDTAT